MANRALFCPFGKLFLLVLLYFLARVRCWTATDAYLVNCGSSSNSSDGFKRTWSADTFSATGISTNTSDQNIQLPSNIPYISARFFDSNGNYSFSVSPGRHWVRLHFYPFSYQSYDPFKSTFSVKVGDYILLSNFSVEAELQSSNSSYLMKEYSLNVVSTLLTIYFLPLNGSYAFVNGIEVVSIPDQGYADDATLLGSATQKIGMDRIAMQTMYRVNVGGSYVNPIDDSGQMRAWKPDDTFLAGAQNGQKYEQKNITYTTGVPDYIAPPSVFGTAREVLNTVANSQNNLTWNFAVDAGYSYYVRFLFAELEYDRPYDRVFNVYVNDQTANTYDLIAITKRYYAYFQDFLIPMKGSLQIMRVQIGPAPGQTSTYNNAILNGLEILKVNDSAGSLAGVSHDLQVDVSNLITSTKKTTVSVAIIGGIVGVAAALGFLIAGSYFLCYRKGKGKWLHMPLIGGTQGPSDSRHFAGSPRSGTGSYISTAPSNFCRHFSFQEIIDATNNFDESQLLGVGGFGKVYKGTIDTGTKVAVKRGNPRSEQGLTEFQTEIEMLSKLRHRHLVSLIGYCDEHSEMILVYDYMENGPLRGHLYGTDQPPLTWKRRLEICIGAARGLHYLHTGAAQSIIHRDVKTTNILVDENFVAKVADFGLSKTGPALEHTHVSTAVKGSFGYLDPEYFRRQQLTEKSDVYSFGVVLVEVLCARPAINPALPRDQVNIAEWAMHWQKLGKLEQIIDPRLKGYCSMESLKKFGEVAEKCLNERGTDRPTMGDVLWNLEYVLQLQESMPEQEVLETTSRQVSEIPLQTLVNGNPTVGLVGNRSPDSEMDSEDASASAVFSQLVNPQGR